MKIETLKSGQRRLTATLPAVQPTVGEHADALERGHPQVVRSGARGRLTGELKRRAVGTRHQRLDGGTHYLFSPCGERKFK